jgi:hypothetical protein
MTKTNIKYVGSPKQLTFTLMQEINKRLPDGAKANIAEATSVFATRVTEAFQSNPARGFKEWHLNIANAALTILDDNDVNVNKLIKKYANHPVTA